MVIMIDYIYAGVSYLAWRSWSEGFHYNYKTNFSFIFNQTCIRRNECKIYGRLIKNNLFQWALTHTPGVISLWKYTTV